MRFNLHDDPLIDFSGANLFLALQSDVNVHYYPNGTAFPFVDFYKTWCLDYMEGDTSFVDIAAAGVEMNAAMEYQSSCIPASTGGTPFLTFMTEWRDTTIVYLNF